MTFVKDSINQRLKKINDSTSLIKPRITGKLNKAIGLTLEAEGFSAEIGSLCAIDTQPKKTVAEVVGFNDNKLLLMPLSRISGLASGVAVQPLPAAASVAVGPELLGRIIDGLGEQLDDLGPIPNAKMTKWPLQGKAINPLKRKVIDTPLDVGIRSINGLLTVGRGQRLGLFAGSGIGKSVLLGMMTKFTTADVIVLALIGERGREVNHFIHKILGKQGMRRAVCVASPADYPPLLRMYAAWRATSIAEYFRAQGKQVLLLFDSLTRFAQAQREVGLAVGEPPSTKGYTPSVFARLPELIERAGTSEDSGGSITAFYTTLAEGDDQQDPIVDSARSILDGHIVLSRDLAMQGHFPAIDIQASISRCANDLITQEQQTKIKQLRNLLSIYNNNKDMINLGAYQAGQNSEIDYAIEKNAAINQYLMQDMQQAVNLRQSIEQLQNLI